MTLYRLLFITLGIALLPFLTTAQETSERSPEKQLETIFEHIPFEGKLNESPKDLNEQFSQNPLGLPAEKNRQMMELFLDAFTADTLIHQAKEVFHEKYDADLVHSVIQELEQGKLESVFEAEKEFYSLQGIRKRVVNRYEMQQNPPSEKRTELINELIETQSASEAEIEVQVILFRAIVEAFGELSDQSLSESQIDGFVDNYRGQIQGQVEQEISNQFLLRYHEVDEATLRKYQSFLESEAGVWLSETSSEAVQSAYKKASNRFLESIRNL